MGKQAPDIAEEFEKGVDLARFACENGDFQQAALTLERLAKRLRAEEKINEDTGMGEEDFVPGFVISGKDEEG